MNDTIEKFYCDVLSDEKFKNSLAKKLNNVIDEADLKNFLEVNVMPLAKKLGYNFTCEELLNYEKEIARKRGLDASMLENIVGGFLPGFTKFASVISLATIGLGFLSPTSQPVYAEPPAASQETSVSEDSHQSEKLSQQVISSDEHILVKSDSYDDNKVETDETSTSNETNINRDSNYVFPAELKELNLFEDNNLDRLTVGIVAYLETENEGRNTYNYFKGIIENAEIMRAFAGVKTVLLNENDEKERQLGTINRLREIRTTMENNNLQKLEFYGFILGLENAYRVNVARQIADAFIEENRAAIENQMNNSLSTNAGISGTANLDGVELSASFKVKSSEGRREKQHYNTSWGVEIGVSGELSAAVASLSVDGKVSIMHALVYQSLEQLLDTDLKQGNTTTLSFRSSEFRDVKKVRQDMQKKEKELLAMTATSLESWAQICGLISQNTRVKLPDLTQTQTPNSEFSVDASAEIKAEIDTFTKLGISVSGSYNKTITVVNHPTLNLINNDCTLSETAGSLENALKILNVGNFKKWQEVKAMTDESTDLITHGIILNALIGDLNDYNHALSVMANSSATKQQHKDAAERKHNIEKRWLTSNLFSQLKNSRLDMLKVSIATALQLKSVDENDTLGVQFNNLYNQIEVLAKMVVFSNSHLESKKKAEYGTTYKANTKGISGSMSFEIPEVGSVTTTLSYSLTDSEFSDESCEDLIIDISFPTLGKGVVDTYAIEKTLDKVIDILSKSDEPFAKNLKAAVVAVKPKFDTFTEVAESPLNTLSDKLLGQSILKGGSTLSICLTAPVSNNTSDTQLPNQELYAQPDTPWILKCIKSSETKSIGVDIKKTPIGISVGSSVNKYSIIIGNDTLNLPISKFNVFELGLKDRTSKKDVSELWTNFTNGQRPQFEEIFVNIAQREGNLMYELQRIFNDIIIGIENSSKTEQEKRILFEETFELFDELINISCPDFADERTEVTYSNTLNIFFKILKLNFVYNYMPKLNKL